MIICSYDVLLNIYVYSLFHFQGLLGYVVFTVGYFQSNYCDIKTFTTAQNYN